MLKLLSYSLSVVFLFMGVLQIMIAYEPMESMQFILGMLALSVFCILVGARL